jgi:protein TonB
LEATISEEGTVVNLVVLSGPDELVESALAAVRQWVYRPTLLNGEPIAVITTIDINYTLQN